MTVIKPLKSSPISPSARLANLRTGGVSEHSTAIKDYDEAKSTPVPLSTLIVCPAIKDFDTNASFQLRTYATP